MKKLIETPLYKKVMDAWLKYQSPSPQVQQTYEEKGSEKVFRLVTLDELEISYHQTTVEDFGPTTTL
jgi:hypothetical protein